ncbi:MAG: hypothetical protein ACT4TC_17365 [Myxococcaceae bacterium]
MKQKLIAVLSSLALFGCGAGMEPIEGDEMEGGLEQSEAALNAVTTLAHSNPMDLIASTGNLYWTSYSINEFGPDSATVYRASKNNTPGQERVLWSESGDQASFYYFGSLTYAMVDGRWFGYFIANYGQTSQLKRVPLEGGTAIVLANLPAYVGLRDLTTDGTTLFWADAQALRSMPIRGGAIATLRSGSGFNKLVLSSNHLYFVERSDIRRMLKTGGGTSIRASDPGITAFALSEVGNVITLYWGVSNGAVRSQAYGGSVMTHQNPIAGRGVTSVEFDGSRVLWTDCKMPGTNYCAVRKRQGTTTTTILADGTVGAGNLQSDAASMYWGTSSGLRKFVH